MSSIMLRNVARFPEKTMEGLYARTTGGSEHCASSFFFERHLRVDPRDLKPSLFMPKDDKSLPSFRYPKKKRKVWCARCAQRAELSTAASDRKPKKTVLRAWDPAACRRASAAGCTSRYPQPTLARARSAGHERIIFRKYEDYKLQTSTTLLRRPS